MNFFGHAVMAGERDARTGFVVGAMLPDFAAMVRARMPSARTEDVVAGLAYHHATDDAFHGAPTFLAASAAAFLWLTAGGMERGPARAIAHIGVEIVLDRTLARNAMHRTRYLTALADDAAFAAVDWPRPEDAARVGELVAALRRHGVDVHEAPPELLAERLHRILAPRPRLAFAASWLPVVTEWVRATDPQLREAAPQLLAEVRAALAETP